MGFNMMWAKQNTEIKYYFTGMIIIHKENFTAVYYYFMLCHISHLLCLIATAKAMQAINIRAQTGSASHAARCAFPREKQHKVSLYSTVQ